MTSTRKLISIAHSYCVALNRRLAHEIAKVGAGHWAVTAVAPTFFHGDLRPINFEIDPDEACDSKALTVRFSKQIHIMHYSSELRTLLRQGWDIVHCWEEPYILAGGQIAWYTPKQARLVFATFQNHTRSYPVPFNWIERYALKRASGWIAFGQTIEDTLSSLPHYSARTRRLISLGVDTNHFRPDPEARRRTRLDLGWDDSDPIVVGYLGRFVSEKGMDLLTRVLDRLEVPWRAMFIGGGPMEGSLRQWGSKYGDRVRVITGVAHNRVADYLNGMDLLCAPSQTTPKWREQLGRMLIEAFACGIPVLASDSGEIPYVVDDAGIIVGEHDDDAWVESLTRLIEDPALRSELIARGLERARTVYAWPIIARQHLDFFEQLLER